MCTRRADGGGPERSGIVDRAGGAACEDEAAAAGPLLLLLLLDAACGAAAAPDDAPLGTEALPEPEAVVGAASAEPASSFFARSLASFSFSHFCL